MDRLHAAGAACARRLGLAAGVALAALSIGGGIAAAQQQQQPAEDPRVEAMRAAIALLRPAVRLPVCTETPEPARWVDAGTPDAGRTPPLVSAHRGGPQFAPENTLAAYSAAYAYGADMVEVDVRQTKDGRLVAMHDATVDRTTNGSGAVSDLTFDEIRRLDAADYAPWQGTAHQPAQVASLEEVLALARRIGAGVEFDIKGDVTDHGAVAALARRYGVVERSIFNSDDVRVLLAAPGARLIYNRDDWEPGFLLYEIAAVAPVFGSRLDEYDAASVAAVHDGCGVVMPHAYDLGPEREAEQFLAARAIGADGVQTNQPDVVVAATGDRVDARIAIERAPRGGGRDGRDDRGGHGGAHGGARAVCLVNARNGLGFPAKAVELWTPRARATMTSGSDGCAAVPPPLDGSGRRGWTPLVARFAGDAAIEPAFAFALVPPRR